MLPQTGIAIVDWALSALDNYGYFIVLGFTTFENLFVVGSLTPGETVVVAAGFVAAQSALMWPLVWLASVVGTMLGSNISFFFGRRGGRPTLDSLAHRLEGTRLGRFAGIHRGSLAEAEAYFERHGSKTIFMSRFAIGFKNFMPVIAGASRMPIFHFELWTFAGAVTYTTAMVTIGWLLGDNFSLALRVAGSIGWAGLALVLLAGASAWMLARRARRASRTGRGGTSDPTVGATPVEDAGEEGTL